MKKFFLFVEKNNGDAEQSRGNSKNQNHKSQWADVRNKEQPPKFFLCQCPVLFTFSALCIHPKDVSESPLTDSDRSVVETQ